MTKFIDFWAPWCVDPETPILAETGYLKASQIKIGHKLLTVDPKTKKHYFKKVQKIRVFKDVPSKKIILETGRELIGDSNHLILTQDGFKALWELTTLDKVLVNPTKADSIYQSSNETVIIEQTGNVFSDKLLREINLLPLRINNPKLPILARLLGFVMTDGYLYEDLKHNIYETHFFVGTEEDANQIKKDLKDLGFNKLDIKKQIKNRQIGERKFVISVLRCRNLNRSLFFLLKSLGAPVGRKKNQDYFVPEWVMSGNLAIKKEFMSGWLGGDGCKIDYYIKHERTSSKYAGFKVNAIEFHKEKNLEREGVLYAEQLSSLFSDLGVKTKDVSSIDDEDGVIISLRVATDYESLLNLARIGYSYSQTKNAKTPLITEFLRYRIFEKVQYAHTKQSVLQQLSLGVSNQSIANSFNLPLPTVVSWKYNKIAQITHPSLNGEALFLKWIENRQEGEFLWEKVQLIEEIEEREVIGITVESPHTLVTNGIISHNCGPCKMTNPIVEELEKELEGKVEFEKINVDEDPSKASQFGVMSIPTFVVMKDGKEVGRKIGFTSKEELLKLINS